MQYIPKFDSARIAERNRKLQEEREAWREEERKRLLIEAAAPDLLEACRRWARWAEQHGAAEVQGIVCDTFSAIAKAEGK